MFSLVVTGSTDGIGLAYAKELAKRGVNIVLISRTLEKLQKVAYEIEIEYGVETRIIQVDFSKGESVYEHIKRELKDIPVGILVNNVAHSNSRLMYLTEMSEKLSWETVIVNCGSVVQMTRMILPQMQKRRKGAIVNISSGMEQIVLPLTAIYAASKVFMRNFTGAVRLENQEYGIFVQNLAPYMVSTQRMKEYYSLKSYQLLRKLFECDPDQYARHAIRTLGIVEHTAGFYIHSAFQLIVSKTPGSE